MSAKKATVEKAELRQLAEMLFVFQQLPQMERVAVQYYIKGRIDADVANIKIPMEFANAEKTSSSRAAAQ